MEIDRFDQLVKSLTTSGSRRGLVGFLTAVPVAGGLAALFGDEVTGKGRRTRRQKASHENEKGLTAAKRKKKKKKSKKKKQCKPQSLATTCGAKCGLVQNNCQQTVNCGSCACDPACDVCFTCQAEPNSPGECVVDPDQQGDACGSAGQICLSDGSCSCDAGSCGLGTVCLDGVCEECGFIGAPCCSSNNCQSGAVCIDGICELCGASGEQCCANDTCNVGRVCLAGTCADCGIFGLPCCAGNACSGGSTCSGGQCV